MKIYINHQTKFFFMGVFAVLILLLFLGSTQAPPPPNYGRFQLSSWATPIDNGSLVGAFVIDTATGETKTVYSRFFKYSKDKESVIFTNNLKKTFTSMK
ncbi:hypothetical protein [Desulfobacula phenolica]|uniref:Uncharacterized protein n=1 Tax=Desulfobacula phenolica TaxID=90732 RepID=A0A1H2HUF2_9BACT|nr:hypothetical protein [Desulfobacula phenolica]SDU35500.1 hypothetical protein SAMN04487931_10753 [Desulfobacula phenolica]